MSHHNLTMLSKGRTRKDLGECVGNYEVGVKRNKAHDTSTIKFPTKMDVNINMTRRFVANRISRHDDAGQVILINICRHNLFVTNIVKNHTKVENFFTNLTRSHVLRTDVERVTES